MAVKKNDLKVYKSENMTQFDDGGGKITGLVLPNNVSNNMFQDITSLERVTGKLEVAKVFVSVDTYGDYLLDEKGEKVKGADGKDVIVPETFKSANVIITENPKDNAVGALCFTTKDWTDHLSDAKEFISNYLTKSVRMPGELVGKQLKGAKVVQIAMQPSAEHPKAGQTIYIVQDEDKSSEIFEYAKVVKVTTEERTVMIQKADGTLVPMTLKFANCELMNQLQNTYDGGELTGADNITKRAFLRETQVVDAARYYGCQNLSADTKIGDLQFRVDSIYGQIVPSTESEMSITDQTAGSDSNPIVKSGGKVSFTTPIQFAPSVRLFCGIGILPDSLLISYNGGEFTDDGGQIMSGDIVVGTVDYARGIILFGATSPTISGSKTITFEAATSPMRVADTVSINVDENNRSNIYNITLFPSPEPGALNVDFMVLGNWYRLRDQGNGVLLGSDDIGVGTINYSTGTCSCTFKEIVDANSEVIFSFGTKINYIDRSKDYQSSVSSDSNLFKPMFSGYLDKQHVRRNSIELVWGVNKKAQDDGNGGFTGDATGYINYATGYYELRFNTLPAKNVIVRASYQVVKSENVRTETFDAILPVGGMYQIQLKERNIIADSVYITYNLAAVSVDAYTGNNASKIELIRYVQDDGNGNLADSYGISGTINYSKGNIALNTSVNTGVWAHKYKTSSPTQTVGGGGGSSVGNSLILEGYEYKQILATTPSDGSQYVTVEYLIADSVENYQEELVLEEYTLKLTPTYQEMIIRGSVMFDFGGKTYIDRDGALYCDVDKTTGAGAYAGRINYASGELILLGWNEDGSSELKIHSLLTAINEQPVDHVVFRVPSAPIRSRSLQIRATRLDGVLLEATADQNGDIKGSAMEGTVDIKTGIVKVNFGRTVKAAGKENEVWFNPESVDKDGNIWQPYLVLADTIKYNAVATSFVPVDKDVVGIAIEKLPTNGKIPIYRKGDAVVIHETFDKLLPLNPPIGFKQSFDVNLVKEIWLEDQNGDQLPCDYIESDLISGELTLKNNDFSKYQQPIIAYALVEEESQLIDVQITGLMKVNKAIRHNFSNKAKCSGLLHIGDMQARFMYLFSQKKWNTNWLNYIEGSATTWRYNATEYPLELTNADTVQERWALIFTDTTQFRIVGESLGQIGVGEVSADCAPINPNTKAPYFLLKKEGWGKGHEAGDVLRFNTLAANFPVYFTRSISPSDPRNEGDSFKFRFRGA